MLPLIKAFVERNYGRAEAVLLTGSQGRSLSKGETLAANRSSDVDLFVFYKKGSGFRSGKESRLLAADGNRFLTADLLILAEEDVQAALAHQKNEAKSPFLSHFILDGVSLCDKKDLAESLKKTAREALAAGPLLLGKKDCHDLTERFEAAYQGFQDTKQNDRRIMACLSQAEMLAHGILAVSDAWRGSSGHFSAYLSKGAPRGADSFYAAVGALFEKGNTDPFLTLWAMTRESLTEKEKNLPEQKDFIFLSAPVENKNIFSRWRARRSKNLLGRQFLKGRIDRLADADRLSERRTMDQRMAVWSSVESILSRPLSYDSAKERALMDALREEDAQSVERTCAALIKGLAGCERKQVFIPYPFS